MRKTVEQRFWEKVIKKGEDECWPWIGAKNSQGYGQFRIDSQTRITAHRFAYTLAKYEPSRTRDIHHTCYNPSCCNPKHLQSVEHGENISDILENKGTCQRGIHPWIPENWIIRGENSKQCKLCKQATRR